MEEADAAQIYRKLAADLRQRALGMNDPKNRTVMLSVADSYDHLADIVENAAKDIRFPG